MMVLAAIALLAIGSLGECVAVGMEIATNEPIYMIMMKVFPWFFGCGAVLLGIAIGQGKLRK